MGFYSRAKLAFQENLTSSPIFYSQMPSVEGVEAEGGGKIAELLS